ncbi:MAG: DUF1837 domain-containing protein [Candidatus Thermoplasmatota archaeon]
MDRPDDFLEVLVHETVAERDLVGLCAGFELGKWRAPQLASHLIKWLPEFALSYEERETLRAKNAVERIGEAARTVYLTDKYARRGEWGELLLHVAIRQVYNTTPAVSRIFFKDAANDTVKGFDCVHALRVGSDLDLWLGEAKLYENGSAAVAAAAKSVKEHLEGEYLKKEFVAIGRKLSPQDSLSAELQVLLNKNTSLDMLLPRIVVPVLIAHDSETTAKHSQSNEAYRQEIIAECRKHRDEFVSATPGVKLRVHVIIVPLSTKKALLDELDGRLKALQIL